MDKQGIKGPSSTWTYLVTDDYFLNNLESKFITVGSSGLVSAAIAMSWPVLMWDMIYKRFFKRGKKQ